MTKLSETRGKQGGPLISVTAHYEDGSNVEIDHSVIRNVMEVRDMDPNFTDQLVGLMSATHEIQRRVFSAMQKGGISRETLIALRYANRSISDIIGRLE